MRSKNKLIHGWGVNDADYEVYKYEVIGGKSKAVWTCPYYKKWCSMLRRCFCSEYQERQPTYKTCTVCENWKHFSNFIKWVDSQPNRDWMNCQLDKDFLYSGNKHYSAETCVFITRQVNCFIADNVKARGQYMIGVSFAHKKNPYVAKCSNPFNPRGSVHIGQYATEMEAHLAWKAKKHEYACMLADLQTDTRVKEILENKYKDNTLC